jgi:hypothetical protein
MSAEQIRLTLTQLNEQVLLEDPAEQILRDAPCGRPTLELIFHDADFDKAELVDLMTSDFSRTSVAIAVGEYGCAFVRRVNTGLVRYFIRGYSRKNRLKAEYFVARDMAEMQQQIGWATVYISKDPRPVRPELVRRDAYRRSEYWDEESIVNDIFKRISPIVTPIIKKINAEMRQYIHDALEKGNYKEVTMYSEAAKKTQGLLTFLGVRHNNMQLPQQPIDNIHYRLEFKDIVRNAFHDMHKKFAPYDLHPSPEDNQEDVVNRELYTQFLQNASQNSGKEVKYIISRFKEYCLTG